MAEAQPEMVELNKCGIFRWLASTFISTINMLSLLRKRLSVDAERPQDSANCRGCVIMALLALI